MMVHIMGTTAKLTGGRYEQGLREHGSAKESVADKKRPEGSSSRREQDGTSTITASPVNAGPERRKTTQASSSIPVSKTIPKKHGPKPRQILGYVCHDSEVLTNSNPDSRHEHSVQRCTNAGSVSYNIKVFRSSP